MAKKREYLYRLEIEWHNHWLWRLRSTHNAQIVATPHEGYIHRAHCIKMVCQIFAGAENVSPWVKIVKNSEEWGKFDRTKTPVRIMKKIGDSYYYVKR